MAILECVNSLSHTLLVGILFQLHRPRHISLPHEYCHYCHYFHYLHLHLKVRQLFVVNFVMGLTIKDAVREFLLGGIDSFHVIVQIELEHYKHKIFMRN